MLSATEQRFRFLLRQWLIKTGQSLDEEQCSQYLAAALCHVAEDSSDQQVATFFCHFHEDHELVTALQQPLHSLHEASWQEWSMRVVMILRHRNLSWSRDIAVSEEDLAQIGRAELLISLPMFHYRSRFSTWAYNVISRSVLRYIRDQGAKKRTAPAEYQPASEEQMLLVTDDQTPDSMVCSEMLYADVAQILHDRLGPRTARVFYLFTRKDMKAAVIATHCNLHLTQVHQLLRDARRVLRNHPDMLLLREHGRD